jgi:hypothetical protein
MPLLSPRPVVQPHGDAALLRWLASRCTANLSTNEQAKAYLRSNGITDECVWRQYRLGVGDAGLLDELDDAARQRMIALGLSSTQGHNPLAGSGVVLPTYDPREPQHPVGFVGLRRAQNKHGFLTPPKGLACAADVNAAGKIILADAPLLALRLTQEGGQGVCLVEDLAVLPPLADWLITKTLIVASCKKGRLRSLKDALSALGVEADPALVNANLPYTPESSLGLLGLSLDLMERRRAPARPATPHLVGEIVRYAQGRLAAGLGIEVLRDLEADDPEFVQAHGLGFLPPDFRDGLGRDAKLSLHGMNIGGSILVPALDESGAAVDALAFTPRRFHNPPVNLLDQPQGLLLARTATAFAEVLVTDSLRIAARLWKEGKRNVLILRDAEDAGRNAERMYRCGVRTATLALKKDMEPVADALKAAGIEVEPGKLPKVVREERGDENPAPGAVVEPPARSEIAEPVAAPAVEEAAAVPATEPPPVVEESPVGVEPPEPPPEPEDLPEFPPKPVFLNYDAKKEQATFNAGEAKYEIEVAVDSNSKLQVRLERGGKVALDRFDLASEPQRRRFAVSAAVRTSVPFETIMEHLLALLDEARRIQSEQLNPIKAPRAKVTVTDEEKAEALAFLKRPDLLDAVAADLEGLGWVGEETTKRLLYLVATSRKLPRPLSATARGPSGAGKSVGIETISQVVPPEDLVHSSRFSDKALFYFEHDALCHKAILVDEADALTPEVLVALRVLQSRGSLSSSFTRRDSQTGQSVTDITEAQGPVAVLTSTTMDMDEQNLSRCFDLRVDESVQQTGRILDAQRRLRADPEFLGAAGRRARIMRRHHALQRLLECVPVVIPFADRIEFPASGVRFRREHERFLNLIEAVALLHQFQRPRGRSSSGAEYVVATERDFEVAAGLAAEHVARAGQELSDYARGVLALARDAGLTEFTMEGLQALRPEWTRYRFRAALGELLKLEYVATERGGRGRTRRYRLVSVPPPASKPTEVRLRPATGLARLAKVGEGDFANLNPEAKTG